MKLKKSCMHLKFDQKIFGKKRRIANQSRQEKK